MKTIGVKKLVEEVLNTFSAPYSAHVIDEVFHAIEVSTRYRIQYDVFCDDLGKAVVNNWCGYWVANALGKIGEVQVPSRKSKLIASYSLLDTERNTILRKPDHEEALQLMSD